MAGMGDYMVFDADNHLYETRDAFTKFLPDRYKRIVDYVDVRGRTKIVINGRISEYIPNPTFEVIARPGAMEDYFRHGNPEGKDRRAIFGEPMKAIPAYREPAPRVELMDELGIDRAMMYPTLGSLIEERMRDEPDLCHATVHALNEWMYETWTFDYEGRIFATPVITLPIVERAIEELEWVVARGARAVLIRPAPVPGYRGPRSFALPEFDPFWEKVVEHDILAALHSSDSGYERYTNEWIGSDSEMLPFQPQAFRMLSSWRPVEDTVSSLICHGALSRFPQLKVAVVENGSSWVNIGAAILGWQIFSLTNVSTKRLGIGNPFALHRGEPGALVSWTHKTIFNFRRLKELCGAHGFTGIRLLGAGYFPFPALVGRLDPWHAHFITVTAAKPLENAGLD